MLLRLAGVPHELLVEAHGSYNTATCLECGKKFNNQETKEFIFDDKVARCPDCGGLVKVSEY